MKKLLFLIGFLILTGFAVRTQTESEEYSVKAVFIYNFTKFIDWTSYNSGDEFIIGILETSPILNPLTEIAKTKKVNDKKIVIRQYNNLEDIGFCHILFIPQNSSISLDEILKKASTHGVLIISEKQEYCKKGTAINFVMINNKLKFEANVGVIKSAGLTASSQLLKLAIIVN